MYPYFANLFFKLSVSIFYKEISKFQQKYRVKRIRLAILRGIPSLCCAHQLALFLVSCPKLTTQLSPCCIVFLGNIYPFTMSVPPEELMTRGKNIFGESHKNSPTYGHVTKLFLELEFQHKGNKQTEKGDFSADFCGFLGRTGFRK